MPKRVNQHEIEDISRAKFQLALPRKWVFRDKAKDYGIDGEVELFDNLKNPSGLVFWVQLKATESKEKARKLNVDFSIESLNYYRTLDIPVLLVRYSDHDDEIYTKWIHNVDLYYAKKNAKTIRINLSETDKWNDATHHIIEEYLKRIRKLKSGSFGLPIPLSIQINEEKVNNISKGILLTQIRKNLQQYTDFVTLTDNQDSSIIASLSKKRLKINISELSGCTFHKINLRTEENFSVGITKDIILGTAVGLIQLRQAEYGGRIIFENELQSMLIARQEMLIFCITPLLNSTFFEETLKIIGQIFDDEDFIGLNVVAHINILLSVKNKNKKVNEVIEKFYFERLEKARLTKDNELIGISHYNIGNILSGKNDFTRSIHHYNLARKFAPIYINQHYFFSELASILFRSRKYKMASKLYAKSLELKQDNHTYALYADSLMFDGKFKESLDQFDKYITNAEIPIDEFVLKHFCLGSIIHEYQVLEQNRNHKEASKHAVYTKKKAQIKHLSKALKFDMLHGLAWFNLGIAHSDKNEFSDAAFCFLMAAFADNNDIEAWKNSTLCALNGTQTREILPLIIRTGYFFNREEFLEALYTDLENQSQFADISKFIEAIEKIIPKEKNLKKLPTVRLLNKEGTFESIDEIIKGHNKTYKQ
jgi:tetratricopeptide (TPR) repeat protein